MSTLVEEHSTIYKGSSLKNWKSKDNSACSFEDKYRNIEEREAYSMSSLVYFQQNSGWEILQGKEPRLFLKWNVTLNG